MQTPFRAQKLSLGTPFGGFPDVHPCVHFVCRFISGQLLFPYFKPWSWQVSAKPKRR